MLFIDDRVFNMFMCTNTGSFGHVSKWVGIDTGCCQKGRGLSCLSSFTTSAGFLFRLVFNSSGVTNMDGLDEGKSVISAAAAAQSDCGTGA